MNRTEKVNVYVQWRVIKENFTFGRYGTPREAEIKLVELGEWVIKKVTTVTTRTFEEYNPLDPIPEEDGGE